MRSFKFTAMALALAIIGLSGAANRVQAQITIRNLIDLTNTVWKYNQNGTNLGTAWRATAYNDSAWASGKSILGFEDSVPFPYTNNPTIPFSQWTQLSLKGPGQANQTITYYFRTHFNFPSNATGVTLVSSNYIDDGALIYLNGQYAGGLRVTANSIFSAVASGGPATEGLLELINLPGTNLVRGDNVLAVEVHQSSTTSSDIVWAMSLNALLPIPIVITNQPDSQTIVAGDPVAFEIGVTGSNPTYNWYKITNAVTGAAQRIAGATTNKYSIAVVTAANAATYFCIASNVLGGVRSSNAVLTVLVDNFGPTIDSAVMADPAANTNVTGTVVVMFSENVQPASATNVNNYSICLLTNIGTSVNITNVPTTDCVVITNATVITNRVTLKTEPFRFGTNYVLTVNNVRDRSSNTNLIAPNSTIGIAWNTRTNFFPYQYNFWRYTFGTQPAATWTAINYNMDNGNAPEGVWGDPSPGPLGYNAGAFDTCIGATDFGTPLSIGYNTYYYRGPFNVASNSPSNMTLNLRHYIDDGAVFYLNGKEIYRFNMPAGAVNDSTAASGTMSGCKGPFDIAVTNLVVAKGANPGLNVLAAEVHQAGGASDITTTFDASLSATYLTAPSLKPLVKPPYKITLSVQGGMMMTISWVGDGLALQTTTDLSGTWVDVPNMSNPYVFKATDSARFFKLANPN